MQLVNVIIIDDDAFVRSSLTAAFKGFGINTVGSGKNYSESLKLCQEFEVDVAIIDFDLGAGPTGADICISLRKEFSQIGLILLTSYTNLHIADPAMPTLPKGTRFLSKSNLENFQILIKEVFSAKQKPLANIIFKPNRTGLTQVQLEVLKLIAEGYSSIEIASKRNVSIKAIESSISKIHRQLGLDRSKRLNQRVQLARAFFKLSGKQPPGAN